MMMHLATNERLARVEEQLRHIEDRMPEVSRNSQNSAKREGWIGAKEDGERDNRAIWSILISLAALAITILINFGVDHGN